MKYKNKTKEKPDKIHLSGELMLARPLTCEAGSNISLAVMHQLEEGDTSIHLLEVKKATTNYFRRRQHPQLANSIFMIGLRSCTCMGRATT